MEALESYSVKELLLLIRGLPSNSRFYGRLMGEKDMPGWSNVDWMILDMRNIVENFRVQWLNSHRKKGSQAEKPQQWKMFPGARRQEEKRLRKRVNSQIDRYIGKGQVEVG